jgi:hypothetical protein
MDLGSSASEVPDLRTIRQEEKQTRRCNSSTQIHRTGEAIGQMNEGRKEGKEGRTFKSTGMYCPSYSNREF